MDLQPYNTYYKNVRRGGNIALAVMALSIPILIGSAEYNTLTKCEDPSICATKDVEAYKNMNFFNKIRTFPEYVVASYVQNNSQKEQ